MFTNRFRLIKAARARRFPTPLCALLVCAMAWLSPARADYGFDPGYSGNYVLDAFASINGQARREGRKLVTLPNGDIVVAGRMRFSNDTLQPFWNIGLVRYNRIGQRVVWTGINGGDFWNSFEYIVYPNVVNGSTGDVRIDAVFVVPGKLTRHLPDVWQG